MRPNSQVKRLHLKFLDRDLGMCRKNPSCTGKYLLAAGGPFWVTLKCTYPLRVSCLAARRPSSMGRRSACSCARESPVRGLASASCPRLRTCSSRHGAFALRAHHMHSTITSHHPHPLFRYIMASSRHQIANQLRVELTSLTARISAPLFPRFKVSTCS